MASWIDVLSLVLTTLFFVGAILGALYVVQTISARFQSMKTSLEDRGITLSREGVALKTRNRFDRDAYVDATQRGLVKVLGAATVGPETRKQAFLPGSNGDSSSSSIGRRAESVKDAIGVALRRSQSDGRGDGR